MIARFADQPHMTAQNYLEWEVKQELRYEYIDGEILAMTGGSIRHNDIALNFYTALRPYLQQKGCRVNVADVKVQARENNQYFYPDLVISCDSEDLKAKDFIQHPAVIIEILSPSTESYDRNLKFKCYRQIPTLKEYILISSEEISIEIYRRGEGRMWIYCQYDLGDLISLASIGFECPVQLIYEGIIFDDTQ